MTSVCITFILNNGTLGFGQSMQLSTIVGVVAALAITAYVIKISKGKGDTEFADEEKPTGVTETV
jgi:ribosome biogenesis protein Tsr3